MTAHAQGESPSVTEAVALAAWKLPFPSTPYDLWTRTNVGEVFPSVVTPLTWSVYTEIANDVIYQNPERLDVLPSDLRPNGTPPALFRAINGRLFYNSGLVYHVATERFGLPSWFYSLSLGGPREGERLGLPQHGWQPLKLARALPRLLREQRRLDREVRRFTRTAAGMRADATRLWVEPIDGLDLAALLARLDDIARRAEAPYVQVLDGTAAALNAYGTLAWLLERWYGDRSIANDLVTGLANLLTAQASVALWQVARAARANPTARAIIETAPPAELLSRLRAEPTAAPVTTALERFFAAHGHRSADEFELAVPRWSEEPTFIVSTLRTYIKASPDLDPSLQLKRQRAKREAAERAVRRRLSGAAPGRWLPWRWLIVRGALHQTRRLLPMRENPKHHFLLYAAELRRTALAIGVRLHAGGVIDAPGDVFYLMRPEIAHAAGELTDLRPWVAVQRDLHARFLRWNPPDIIPGAEVEAVERALDAPATHAEPPAAQPEPSGLTGIAASAGVVSGRARVAMTPEEGSEIEPGEILVAPFTDPGWTPLFAVAGAIVMDLGGLLSHGAIVAREYGIPAVVNTRTATKILRTGQQITVNGGTGEVTWG